MSLVLGMLFLGGSAVSIWAGITDPEGGVWAGLRNVMGGETNAKHDASAQRSAFIADALSVGGTATATDPGTPTDPGAGGGTAAPAPITGSAKTVRDYGGVKAHVAKAGHLLANMFHVATVYGFAARNIAGTHTLSDHALGLALDFMGAKQNLADYARAHAAELNITYVIYNRRIWSVARNSEGWRPYSGVSPHTDHVHISFTPQPHTAPAAPVARAPRHAGHPAAHHPAGGSLAA